MSLTWACRCVRGGSACRCEGVSLQNSFLCIRYIPDVEIYPEGSVVHCLALLTLRKPLVAIKGSNLRE